LWQSLVNPYPTSLPQSLGCLRLFVQKATMTFFKLNHYCLWAFPEANELLLCHTQVPLAVGHGAKPGGFLIC
jgi:hypothetical protein